MSEPVVLVITGEFDPTADLVIQQLHERDHALVRFDLADLPEAARLTGTFTGEQWSGVLQVRDHYVDLADVVGAYYRRPGPITVSDRMNPQHRRWAEREAQHGFLGVLTALRCRWLNHPHRNTHAESKPHQIARAREAGLRVPDTLITNSPEQAQEFCRSHPDGVVYKALRGRPDPATAGEVVALWTTPVSFESITEGVALTAHQFQATIPKQADIRLTVVGQRCFAARMDSDEVDFRANYNSIRFSAIETPPEIAAGVRRLMDSFGLTYASMDFLLTPDDEWVFIGDLNPNGQYGFAQIGANLPIAPAIADYLVGPRPAGA